MNKLELETRSNNPKSENAAAILKKVNLEQVTVTNSVLHVFK